MGATLGGAVNATAQKEKWTEETQTASLKMSNMLLFEMKPNNSPWDTIHLKPTEFTIKFSFLLAKYKTYRIFGSKGTTWK